MRILVTGGAGFIGSHIVDDLLAAGHDVVVYDNFSTGLAENLAHAKGHVEVVEGDILEPAALAVAMRGCHAVSHQAAQLEIFLAASSPEHDLSQNTIGTLNVLRAAKAAGVKRVVNASSACVYGQTTNATVEDSDPNPNWAYGVSKLAAEKYCNIWSGYEGLPVVSLRYGIVYGEREWYRRVLPIFVKRAILAQPPVVFGDGKQVRDFLYVGDLVRLHRSCIERDDLGGQVFNVGSGMGTTIAELAFLAGKLGPIPLAPVFEETKEGEESKLVAGKRRNTAELGTMWLDIAKARRLLGWNPAVSLAEGLRREYDWAKGNLHRWDKIRYTDA